MTKKSMVLPLEVEQITLSDDLDLSTDEELAYDDLDLSTDEELAYTEILAPVKPKPSLGISSLITDVDDFVEYLTWVIYGKNGTGKTTLLSTLENVLILAVEDGTLSIRDKAKNAKKIKIDSWDKVEAVYWLLKNGEYKVEGIEIPVGKGKFLVKSIAIDTITRLSEVCMRSVVLGEDSSSSEKDVIKRTLKDWGEMSEKIRFWLQKFEELPLHRVWLFQEQSNSEEVDTDEFSIYPAINKSLRTYVLSEADIIARTYIAKVENSMQYRLSAAASSKYVSKDRTNTINKGAITNPDLTQIYNKIFRK